MKKIIVALVLGLALSVSACGNDDEQASAPVTVTATPETSEAPVTPDTPVAPPTTEAPSDDIDTLFLQVLRQNTDSWDNIPDDAVVSLAESMCGAWDEGSSFRDIASIFLKNGYSPEESGFFIGAGTQAYCPEYSGRIG